MNFMEELNYVYVLAIVIIVFVVGELIVRRKNSLKLTLQFRLVFYGFVMVILYLSFPRIPSLASIGSHMDLNDNENKERLLTYLEKSNDVLHSLIEKVKLMIFITVFWLISIIISIIKHFKLESGQK